jgi:hypothetical protein
MLDFAFIEQIGMELLHPSQADQYDSAAEFVGYTGSGNGPTFPACRPLVVSFAMIR